MKKLQVLVVDDERSARDLIINLLSDVDEVEIVGEAENAEAALLEVQRLKPDVILLDIQMPMEDGFSLIEKLQKQDIQLEIIFITAYEKYAIRAIKYSAFDYLLKPVKKKELVSSLLELAKKKESSDIKEKFNTLIYQLSDHKKLNIYSKYSARKNGCE